MKFIIFSSTIIVSDAHPKYIGKEDGEWRLPTIRNQELRRQMALRAGLGTAFSLILHMMMHSVQKRVNVMIC